MSAAFRRPALAAALLCAVLPAAAQQVYKHVLPDGRVIYSDEPQQPPGAKSKAIDVPPPPSEADKRKAQQRAREEARKRQEVDDRLDARRKRLDNAERELEAARKSLADAEAELERGREPLPGERSGNVGPNSRLNEGYWARQAENERAVESARKAFEDAQRARNEAR
jgi:flagellar motility protein MotE (MotC chaperone)